MGKHDGIRPDNGPEILPPIANNRWLVCDCFESVIAMKGKDPYFGRYVLSVPGSAFQSLTRRS